MEKLYVIFLIALVLAHAGSARNIPNDDMKPSTNALAPVENTVNVVKTTANAPAANGVAVGDEKNFITYGGVGGFAGIGGYAGVIPVLGGIGGGSGLGGLGGLGGAGGAGGLGGLGGAGGLGGGIGGGAGGIGGGGVGGVGGIVP